MHPSSGVTIFFLLTLFIDNSHAYQRHPRKHWPDVLGILSIRRCASRKHYCPGDAYMVLAATAQAALYQSQELGDGHWILCLRGGNG